MKWEYTSEIIPQSRFDTRISELGNQGWEIYKQKESMNESSQEKQFEVYMKRQTNDGPQLLKS